MAGATPVLRQASASTYAELLWPETSGAAARWVRGLALAALGATLLTISAKIQVPGPVPMTLQTLAVLALGAMLGSRLALAAVALYLAEGALGLPVFANTPPLPAGIGYLVGPTGGFLIGFALAAALVGVAADRGLARRPLIFAAVLACGSALLLACGWMWLAFGVKAGGLGAWRAFELGVRPFLLGEGVKLAIAALAIPLSLDALERLVRR